MENRFEAKSSYGGHKTSGLVAEQELEKFFMEAAHKELQEKRRDEEGKEMMREWGMARGRIEAEITRRKEHNVQGSNFEKARGWVRSNWKTKKHDYKNETEDDFLHDNGSDESADEVAEEIEPAGRLYGGNKHGKDSPREVNFVDLTQDEEEYGFRPSTNV